MENFDEILQEARIAWVLAEVGRMKMRFPVAEISIKTGYSKGTISNYLNRKGVMSLDFIKTFCKKFQYDFDKVNHGLIADIKKQADELAAQLDNKEQIVNADKSNQNKDVKEDTSKDKGSKLLAPSNKKEDIDVMIQKLIDAQADYAIAAKEDAIARRNNSEVQLRLTAMLDHAIKEDAPAKRRLG